MPKKPVEHGTKNLDVDLDESGVGDLEDDEPIPARRDTRIFHREKDSDKKPEKDDEKDEGFEEDVFV